jgi:hypothetical protein
MKIPAETILNLVVLALLSLFTGINTWMIGQQQSIDRTMLRSLMVLTRRTDILERRIEALDGNHLCYPPTGVFNRCQFGDCE